MTPNQTSHRTRAVLAAAAVLGLGAVGTLALWSDSEFSFGAFRTVAFTVESAPTPDAPFEKHDSTGNAVVLDFKVPAEGLRVNEPVDAEVWLRMGSETSGSVQLQAPTFTPNELDSYIDITVTQAACGEAGAVLQQGLLESLTDATNSILLPSGTESTPGEARGICIEASLRDTSNLPAGNYSTGAVEWEFVVTEETG